jgi:hypothetical protein
MCTKFRSYNLKRRNHWEDIDRWVDSEKKLGGRVWTGLIWHRIGTSVGSCEYDYESLGFIKGRKFLD